MDNTQKTRALAECAVLIALGTILAQLKIYELPNGGSITAASMVPFILISYRHGLYWGMLSGLANSLLQMMLGGIWPTPAGTAAAMAMEVVFDYLLPFSVLGLACLFAKPFPEEKRSFAVVFGAVCVCFLRFVSHFLSGFIVWGSITNDGIGAVTYSLTYNASYMGIETVITAVAIALLFHTAPKMFRAV